MKQKIAQKNKIYKFLLHSESDVLQCSATGVPRKNAK